jgi:hypothetical protein
MNVFLLGELKGRISPARLDQIHTDAIAVIVRIIEIPGHAPSGG